MKKKTLRLTKTQFKKLMRDKGSKFKLHIGKRSACIKYKGKSRRITK